MSGSRRNTLDSLSAFFLIIEIIYFIFLEMLSRSLLEGQLKASLNHFPITALVGPRQCGKTTLARLLDVVPGNYFDLEDPLDEARLGNPREVLGALRGVVVLDEFQRMPHLFPVLRVLADREKSPARFLILGSASPELSGMASESLAGRIQFLEMGGFTCGETGTSDRDVLWWRGGFPGSYLAPTDEVSVQWRRAFVRTFLERDLPAMGIRVASGLLRRFWVMVAHYHGQIWNSSGIAASLDISHTTARSYLDALTSALVICQLQPWLPNLKKRMVRSPKIYFRDSGLLHTLLQADSLEALQSNPRYGASWEGFVLEQLRAQLQLESEEMYFWATHGGAEMDLVVRRGGKLYGFEFKTTEKPAVTHSMTIAQKDLGLEKVFLVYPGRHSFFLRDGMETLGYPDIPNFQLP